MEEKKRMTTRLKELFERPEIFVLAGGMRFFADYRPTYRAGPAQDMWHRLLLFYEKHLKD